MIEIVIAHIPGIYHSFTSTFSSCCQFHPVFDGFLCKICLISWISKTVLIQRCGTISYTFSTIIMSNIFVLHMFQISNSFSGYCFSSVGCSVSVIVKLYFLSCLNSLKSWYSACECLIRVNWNYFKVSLAAFLKEFWYFIFSISW